MSYSLKIVLATRNLGKLREIQEILSDLPVQLQSLNDYPGAPEAEEKGDTYLENAREKARLIAEYTGHWALADDSGLEVEALQGRPGVRSARYAGLHVPDAEHYRKLLAELKNVPEPRRAKFLCILVLRNPDGREHYVEGTLPGRIIDRPKGQNGFGYDPIFVPDGGEKTLAELSPQDKNSISHRHQALKKISEVIKSIPA